MGTLAAPECRTIRAQPSWMLRSSTIEMAVTHLGGHMAPVFFDIGSSAPVQPYAISPWQGETEGLPSGGSELPLRGDFFCLPFGSGLAPNGEVHTPHGQTSSGPWTHLESSSSGGTHSLKLGIELPVRKGRVTQTYTLHDGENAVYTTTAIEGFAGPATMGHHAVLAVPAPERALLVSTSPIVLGMTCPYPFADPSEGNYQSLATGRRFTRLSRAPSIFRETPIADCSAFPVRPGFTDLLQLAQRPRGRHPAWTVAVNSEAGYLWFAFKDPAVLPSTVLWIENRGRHSTPWKGRTSLLGLEDVCSYFDTGISASAAPNAFSLRGVPTVHRLSDKSQFEVRYIQGIVRTPAGFGCVKSVRFRSGEAVFIDVAGNRLSARVRHEFLAA